MDALRALLEQQPMVALFLTIAVGYLVGEINIKGLSLGAGAVLFVALAVGWFAPKSVPAPMLGTLGLALFLYAVGIQYGKEFFRGLASADGRKANFVALIGLAAAGMVSLALAGGGIDLGYAIGLFAGSGTSTPALQAAIQALGNDSPAMGYSVAYPFGVFGPILFIYLASLVRRPQSEPADGGTQEIVEVAIRNPTIFGRRLGQVTPMLPAGVQVVAVRENHRNEPPSPDVVLDEDDVVLLAGPSTTLLERARQLLGDVASGRITNDRRDLDFLRVFASKRSVVGRALCDLPVPVGFQYSVMHVRRGDTDLLARPDLVLEYGDRIGLLANRASFASVRSFFGDSIRGTAEFSYISIGIGMVIGLLAGLIHVPIPGLGKLTIGLAGVLVVALVLGKLRRTGGMSWTIPLSANLVLRNLGLTLFLAQVGMSSGPKFVATVAETGFLFLGLGAIVLLALVLPILLLGLFVFRMPFDQMAGIIAGACGNPAILAYANKLAPSSKPDIAYAMIFPSMTILKILFVDIVPALYGG